MKILHVDDEPDIREIAQLSLEIDPENDVVSASSGAEALKILEGFTPDAILLDVMMPEMDGPELLARLQEQKHFASIPVVFMTAAAQRQTIDDLMALGAGGVISKPFDPMELATELRNVIETRPS